MTRRTPIEHAHNNRGSGGTDLKPSLLQINETYDVTEDSNGDLVIRDDAGNDVLIWDKSAGQWDFKSQTLSNIGSLKADDVTINNLSAVLEKTTDQSISADTDTTIDWDNQDVDTDIYTYDTTNDEIDVLVSGDYRLDISGEVSSVNDQDRLFWRLYLNGTLVRMMRTAASGAKDNVRGSVLFKNLSANDTIRIDMRLDTAGTLTGADTVTWAMLTKEA